MMTETPNIPTSIETRFGTMILRPLDRVVFGSVVYSYDGRPIGKLVDNYPAERAKINAAGKTIRTSWKTLVYVSPNSTDTADAPPTDPEIYRFVREA